MAEPFAMIYKQHDLPSAVKAGIRENFLQYAEQFFFLLVAKTYINFIVQRGVFGELRFWLMAKVYSSTTLISAVNMRNVLTNQSCTN